MKGNKTGSATTYMAGSPSSTSRCTSGSRNVFRRQRLWATPREHPFLVGLVIVCLLLMGGLGYVLVYPQLAGLDHWQHARQALEEDDLPRAQRHLERCLQVWPRSGETLFLLARTERRAGDFAAAQAHLQEAERLGWAPALVDLERLLREAQAGLVQPVEEPLERYLQILPDQRRVIFEALVKGCLQASFLDDAYGWTSRWVEAYPGDYRAHLLRGRVLESGLRYDLAAGEYQQALQLKPDLLPAHLALGEMLRRRGQYAQALPHFQAYLQCRPDHAPALLGLARCQRFLSPPETALATLSRLLAKQPDYPEALLLRGQLELERGHASEALRWLERAEHLLPQDVDTYQALATASRLLGRKEQAEAYEKKRQETERDLRRMEELTKQIIQNPRDERLRYEAGTILLRLGQEQQGARWLASALLIDPHHEPTKKALAACLPKLGDPKLVAYYRRFVGERERHNP
jgi:tetratricopeptide (TPR) repeat protein